MPGSPPGAVVATGGLAEPTVVDVRTERINLILNTQLSTGEIAGLLDPIGYASSPVEGGLRVEVPSWRPDSAIEEDIAEEVGRHHGYARSGKRVPTPTQAGALTVAQRSRRRIRRALTGAGYAEAMPNPFLAPDDLARAGLDPVGITLANPLVAEESVLRTSLLPGLLKAVARNQAHRVAGVRLFELGQVFQPAEGELPDEYEVLAAIGAGHTVDGGPGGVNAAEAAVRALYRFGAEMALDGLQVANAVVPGLHPTRAAEVRFRGKVIGAVGEVDPGALERFEVAGRVSWLELRVRPVLDALGSPPRHRPVSLYPSSDIDLALAVPDGVPATDVARTIKKAGDGLIRTVELFDVFRGPQVGEGRRSLAYQLRLQADDRTLTDDEVAAVRQRCIDEVATRHGAVLRG